MPAPLQSLIATPLKSLCYLESRENNSELLQRRPKARRGRASNLNGLQQNF
jgi:hypothetical protein